MKYLEPSFSVPPARLRNGGRNTHGQSWEDIFSVTPLCLKCGTPITRHPSDCSCRGAGFCPGCNAIVFAESIPDATGNDLPLADEWAEHGR